MKERALWHRYSFFRCGKYLDTIRIDEHLLESEPDELILHLCIASRHGYEESRQPARKGPNCDFRAQLIFHIVHRASDEQALLDTHSHLVSTLEN
jgi:intraflagellar transport protein 56